jgi:hypothetical protein
MKLFYTLLLFSLQISVFSQRFDGQWKGGFTDNSTSFVGFGGENIDYVLELECRGSKVHGYSYTYFKEGTKRYYTICKLTGTLNKATREISVTEFEVTKKNTPPDFRNCFQTHKLRYSKDSDALEILEGTWIPAPNQQGDCGFGKTTLARRLIKKAPLRNNPKTNTTIAKKTTPFRDMNQASKPPVAIKQKSIVKDQNKKPVTSFKPPVTKKEDVVKNDKPFKTDIPLIKPFSKKEEAGIPSKLPFEKRSKAVLKTIEIEQETFTVQVYDNGEIDGDSVSVFYNGSLLASHERLSDKPITFNLSLNKSNNSNELTMYAENLGEIPPNTALMIVTDGDKRYEVRITSDTQKNGTIAFTHKKSLADKN